MFPLLRSFRAYIDGEIKVCSSTTHRFLASPVCRMCDDVHARLYVLLLCR